MQLHYRFIDNKRSKTWLLVHGFLGSMHQWEDLIPMLSKTNNLLLVELPGHGASPSVDKDYTIHEIATALHGICMELHLPAVHLLGHSMGGYVCSAFAKAHPAFTKSLTLLNSIAGPDTLVRKENRDRAINLIETHQEAYVSMAIANLFTLDEREQFAIKIEQTKKRASHIHISTVIQCLKAMRDRPGVLQELSLVNDFPIYFIAGSLDPVIDSALIQEEVQLLNAQVDMFTGGHMLLLTHSHELSKILHFIDFL